MFRPAEALEAKGHSLHVSPANQIKSRRRQHLDQKQEKSGFLETSKPSLSTMSVTTCSETNHRKCNGFREPGHVLFLVDGLLLETLRGEVPRGQPPSYVSSHASSSVSSELELLPMIPGPQQGKDKPARALKAQPRMAHSITSTVSYWSKQVTGRSVPDSRGGETGPTPW